MSLATRCTACGTIFRVVQDQLRVSEGWVRCGRCAEVFDAREQLFDIDREAPPPWPAAPAAPAFVEEPAFAPPPPPARPAPPPPEPDTTWEQPTETFTRTFTEAPPPAPAPVPVPPPPPPPPPPPSPPPAPIAAPSVAPAAARRTPVPDDAFESSRFEAPFDSRFDSRLEPRWSDEDTMIAPATIADEPMFATSLGSTSAAALPDSELATMPDVVLSAQLAGGGTATSKQAASATPAAMPSFMRAAERAERWRRPGVRIALGAGALTLTALLALQATLHFHDALAAIHPPLRPALASLCGMAGCEIQPWRRIDALSVESSALTLAGGGTNQYQLTVSLRNKSGVEVATPWIELSLTDAAGLTIARRMVAPSEFKGSKPSMPPTSELPLQLVMSTGEQKVSGYNIEIFHP